MHFIESINIFFQLYNNSNTIINNNNITMTTFKIHLWSKNCNSKEIYRDIYNLNNLNYMNLLLIQIY